MKKLSIVIMLCFCFTCCNFWDKHLPGTKSTVKVIMKYSEFSVSETTGKFFMKVAFDNTYKSGETPVILSIQIGKEDYDKIGVGDIVVVIRTDVNSDTKFILYSLTSILEGEVK